jgi:hypothetical protein
MGLIEHMYPGAQCQQISTLTTIKQLHLVIIVQCPTVLRIWYLVNAKADTMYTHVVRGQELWMAMCKHI